MQPLIYKQRIHRWGFRKSLFASLGFHLFVLFGISFVVIQQPWKFQEETIVNVKFANSAFDMAGQSFGEAAAEASVGSMGAAAAPLEPCASPGRAPKCAEAHASRGQVGRAPGEGAHHDP